MASHPIDEKAAFNTARRITSPDARAEYLQQICGADAEALKRVVDLLRVHEQEHSFLESPAVVVESAPTIEQALERPGTPIGPYKLLQQIGEGGMGVVYMAEQTEPVQRKVALKVIKPGMDSRQVIARFEAERQALAMMDHVNIARVLDAGTTGGEPSGVSPGRPYFVMELVHGVPITKYCDDNHLTPRERLELFVPVCQAIQHAHQKGIIHRDLKPSNVMVTLYDGKPVPKVIDFGVAKATEQKLTERTLFTQYGTMVGTLEYMSPEQAEMSALGVDTRSDIYSLGVLLYELLTGSTPLSSKRMKEAAYAEILRMIKEDEPPKPSTRLSESGEALASISAQRQMEPAKLTKLVKGELDWIVMRTLEKDRNRRYETASGFAADVQRYLADEPVQACPPSASYRLRKFVRRNKAPALAAALVLVTLVSGIVGTSIGLVRAMRAETLARTRLANERDARAQADAARKEAVAGRQAAQMEAARAMAVSNLLQEMLTAAHPDSASGKEYTVRNLLDRFSADLDDQLTDQPEVEATVRQIIGSVYTRLNLLQQAEPHLQRSLELRRQVFGERHVAYAETLRHLAWNRREADRASAEAEALAREALSIYRENANAAGALEAWWLLVLCLGGQSRPAESELEGNQALQYARAHKLQEHGDVANLLHHLAGLEVEKGDFAAAERLARESVEMHFRVHGENHPETAFGWQFLGSALQGQGNAAEAKKCFVNSLNVFRRNFSDDHPFVRFASKNVAEAEAEEAVRTAVSLSERLVQTFPENGDVQLQLAHSYLKLSDLLEDKGQQRQAVEAGESAKGSLARAIAAYHKAIELDPQFATAYYNLGNALREQKQPDEAIEAYRKAIELDPKFAMTYYNRAQTYAALGHWAKAAADFESSLELEPKKHEAWRLAAYAYLAAGDAASYRRTCHELVERFGQTDDPVMAERTAKVCLLAPDAVADFGVVERLAQVAVTGTEQHGYYHFFVLANGLTEDRAGRPAEAVKWLHRFAPDASRGYDFDGIAFAALAMAQHRLGRIDEAKESLAKAKAIVAEKMPDPSHGRLFEGNWHDWLHAQMLSREAEELLTKDAEFQQHDLKKTN